MGGWVVLGLGFMKHPLVHLELHASSFHTDM